MEEYLEELERTKEGRPEQVRDGIEIYVGLWRRAIEKGLVSSSETVGEALAKVEDLGGLYKATEG